MNIDLPLETWAVLLGFLPRDFLGRIVPSVGSQFATNIQFYLHRYSDVTLGNLEIVNEDGAAVVRKWTRGDLGPAVPFDADPANEMPQNIKSFDALTLSHHDNNVIGWLQKFADRHLFTNVHLHLQSLAVNHTLRSLDTLLPLLESIESVRIQDQHVLENIYAHYQQRCLAQARILQVCLVEEDSISPEYDPPDIDLFCQWLSTPHASNGPRVLQLSFSCSFYDYYVECLLGRFEEDFIEALECISYFVCFQLTSSQRAGVEEIVEFKTLQNARTKEVFSIKAADDNGRVLVSRLPEQANPRWIAEKEKEVMEWDFFKQSRRIHLTEPLNY